MLIAIYYPKTQTLVYWTPSACYWTDKAPKPMKTQRNNVPDEKAARSILRDHIVKTEIIQELEIMG